MTTLSDPALAIGLDLTVKLEEDGTFIGVEAKVLEPWLRRTSLAWSKSVKHNDNDQEASQLVFTVKCLLTKPLPNIRHVTFSDIVSFNPGQMVFRTQPSLFQLMFKAALYDRVMS